MRRSHLSFVSLSPCMYCHFVLPAFKIFFLCFLISLIMVCIGAISFAFIQLEFVQILEALDLYLSPNLENFNYFKISGFWEYFYIYQRRYKDSIEFPHTYYPDSPIVNILHIIMVYLLNYKSNVGTMPLTIGFPLMFFFFCFRNPV